MRVKVSPKHYDDQVDWSNPDQVTDVFEAAIDGWILAPAGRLDGEHEGLARMMLLLPYCELVGILRSGGAGDGGKQAFVSGAGEVLDHPSSVFEILYDEVRSGLLHSCLLKSGGVYASGGYEALVYEDGQIGVNPQGLHQKIAEHFQIFIEEMKDAESEPLRGALLEFFGRRSSQGYGAVMKRTTPGERASLNVRATGSPIPPAGELAPPDPGFDDTTGNVPRRRNRDRDLP